MTAVPAAKGHQPFVQFQGVVDGQCPFSPSESIGVEVQEDCGRRYTDGSGVIIPTDFGTGYNAHSVSTCSV